MLQRSKYMNNKLECNCNNLPTRIHRAKEISQLSEAKMMQELEKWSHRDDMRVSTLPEGTYGSNAARFLSTFHAEWFPELAGKQIGIIRVRRIRNRRGLVHYFSGYYRIWIEIMAWNLTEAGAFVPLHVAVIFWIFSAKFEFYTNLEYSVTPT